MATAGDGFYCGSLGGIKRVDAAGTASADLVDLRIGNDPVPFNPFAADTTGFFAFPAGRQDGGLPLYRVDVSGPTATPLLCGIEAVGGASVTDDHIVWTETREISNSVFERSLRHLSR
jgi:hypothetical protein